MTSQDIYGWVKDLPIVDWHNHLDPKALQEDAPFGSLYEVWVKPDPYKHRAMRICGVPERLITGDAPESEKMAAWESTLPKLVGNPLFAWAQMELDFLKAHPLETLTPLKLLKLFNVAYASPCMTAEELGRRASPPGAMQTGPTGVSPVGARDTPWIIPSLRMNAGDVVALDVLERFAAAGCRVVDVSVDDAAKLEENFESLSVVAGFAAAHGWTMLLHLGALRETSDRLRRAAGSAGGFAGMRAPVDPELVARFLNRLEGNGCDGQDARRPSGGRASGLPRTVLMTLNPEAHAQLAVLAGSFVEDGVPGKVQLGPAWWWCDHCEGIFDVFEKTAAYGVLLTFIGMTTDSRSLLSFVRHDYFRRLLARWMAQKAAAGDFPDDESLLRPICENICYRNAAERVALG